MSSAVSSIKAAPNRFVYGSTKAAVIGLTKAIAADFIRSGIRCNAICPGTVQSPSLDQRIAAQGDVEKVRPSLWRGNRWDALGVQRRLRRWPFIWRRMNPAYTTGQTHIIDGGFSLSKDQILHGEKMKLLRYGSPGQEKPGLLAADGEIRDLSGIIPDLAGESLLPESIEKTAQHRHLALAQSCRQPRIGPCVGGVGKFICIGLNYSDHAKESGMAVPVEPVIFMKATSSICGPDDDRCHSARIEEDGLGGRTRRGDRQAGKVRGRGGRAFACCGVLRDQ